MEIIRAWIICLHISISQKLNRISVEEKDKNSWSAFFRYPFDDLRALVAHTSGLESYFADE